MFDLVIVGVFELISILIIVGTIREWWKSRRSRELLPIAAYLLAMVSFLGSPANGAIPPFLAGVVWIVIGVIVRSIVRRRPTG